MRYMSAPHRFFELDIKPNFAGLCRVVLYILLRHHLVNLAVYIHPLGLVDLLPVVQPLP